MIQFPNFSFASGTINSYIYEEGKDWDVWTVDNFFFFFWPEWTVDNLQATWKSIELVEEDVTN